MAALRDPGFWGQDGRVGVITQGTWANRLVLIYQDSLETWTFIPSSTPEKEMLDFYPVTDQAAEEVIAELGIVWLARNQQETQLEKLIFDQRSHLDEDTSIRGMLAAATKRLLGKK